jgi:DNA polymerase-3 subunit delta
MSAKASKHLFITGNDEFRIAEQGKALSAELAPEDPMNLEELEGRADNVEQACEQIDRVQEALLTLPFMGGRKLVYLKNASFFQDGVIGRSERVQERLDKLLETLTGLNDGSVQCLITAPSADKRKRFYKQFQKFGEVELCEVPELQGAGATEAWIGEIEKIMRQADLEPGPGTAECLLELIGNQPRQLHAEIEKLSLYVHPRKEVQEEDLRAIVSTSRELLVWDLCDAVTSGKTSESAHLVRQLLAQGESEVGILILLSNQIRLAAMLAWMEEAGQARLQQKGYSHTVAVMPEVQALLPVNASGKSPSPYRLGRILSRAQHRNPETWFAALEVLYRTHLQLLSGRGDRRKTLETAVVRLCEL